MPEARRRGKPRAHPRRSPRRAARGETRTPGGKASSRRVGRRRGEQDEHAAVLCAADQPAERLGEPGADDAVVIGGAAAGRARARRGARSGRGQGTPSITTSRSEWPGTSTPSRSASVPSRRGARIVAEDVDQRAGVDRIDMLGVERQAGAGEPVGDPGVDRAQPLDRGEQAERAALGRLDQPRIGAGERGEVALA